jgi:hypothetical protein
MFVIGRESNKVNDYVKNGLETSQESDIDRSSRVTSEVNNYVRGISQLAFIKIGEVNLIVRCTNMFTLKAPRHLRGVQTVHPQ